MDKSHLMFLLIRKLKSVTKPKVVAAIKKIKLECAETENNLPKSSKILSLLTSYFDEDESAIVKYFTVSAILCYFVHVL